MTRTEIIKHRSELQVVCTKIHENHPNLYVEPTGFKLVDAALGACRNSKPNPTLKNFDRLIRHYRDTLTSKPEAIAEFNTACEMVNDGQPHDQAIRLARKRHKKDSTNENKTSASKHDRVLDQILSI